MRRSLKTLHKNTQAIVLILLMGTVASNAQAAAEIVRTTPERLVLTPGTSGVITLQGKKLDAVSGVDVKQKRAQSRDLSARLQKGRNSVSITVQASSRALGDYALEIQTGARPFVMPVEVVSAAAMRAALAGKLPAGSFSSPKNNAASLTKTPTKTPTRKPTNSFTKPSTKPFTKSSTKTATIERVSPKTLTLYAGGKTVMFNATGSNLDSVGTISIVAQTTPTLQSKTSRAGSADAMVKRTTRSKTKLTIALQASKAIAPGQYTLNIPLGKTGSAENHTIALQVKAPAKNTAVGAGPNNSTPVIQAFTVSKVTNNVAVRAGDTVQFQLTPPIPAELENEVTIRLVEANKTLAVSGEDIAANSRRYQVKVPPGLELGPHTVQVSAGAHSDTSDIYVYPTTNPALVAVSSPYGNHPSGATYLHYNEPVNLTTNGGDFDFAKAEITSPQGSLEYSVQKNGATTLSTGSAISFQSLGPLEIGLNFGIDAAPPSFVTAAGSANSFMFAQGASGLPVYVVGKPKITSCTTPGAPHHSGYANPIFAGVDIELTGENLMLPQSGGINPSVGLGTSANSATPGAQIMPGSTAEKMIVRLPPNPSFANMGSVFTVNNGIVSGSSTSASCLPNTVLVRVNSVQPNTLFNDPATTDITLSGPYLGWLAETVSLNGVTANIRQRSDHSLVVRWNQPIETGLVTVETKAGTALTGNNSTLTVVEQ